MRRRRPNVSYLLCVKNAGYPASLLVRRLYERIADEEAESHGLVRILDESDGDYLYPAKFFVTLEIPKPIARVIAA
jgi:hypothetical protein